MGLHLAVKQHTRPGAPGLQVAYHVDAWVNSRTDPGFAEVLNITRKFELEQLMVVSTLPRARFQSFTGGSVAPGIPGGTPSKNVRVLTGTGL